MWIRLLFVTLSALALSAQVRTGPRSWDDATKLEAELSANPDNVSLHHQLANFYTSQARTDERAKAPRRQHVLWLIELHPDNVMLASAGGGIPNTGEGADPEGYALCDAAWRKQFTGPRRIVDVYYNAAAFYQKEDPAHARQLLEEGLRIYPGNYRLMQQKGVLLAYSVAGVQPADLRNTVTPVEETPEWREQATRDRQELEDTTSAILLDSAGRTLTLLLDNLHSRLLAPTPEAAEDYVLHLYERAIELEPHSSQWKSSLIERCEAMAAHERAGSKIRLLEKGLAATKREGFENVVGAKLGIQAALADAYVDAGELSNAAALASDMLARVAGGDANQNSGASVYAANMVLGKIAMRHGDTAEAARRLLAAGRTSGTSQVNYMGPDWTLPQELLSHGERTAVITFLEECHSFWINGGARLDAAIATIRSGGIPNFMGPTESPRSRFLGKPASDFHLKNLDGTEVSLSSFKGKVVLLDFWATWCGPCRAEMPEFERIHKDAAAAAADVVVLALDVREDRATVADFIAKEKYTFPVLLSGAERLDDTYGVNAFPTTFAIDANGRIADVQVGSANNIGEGLHALIVKARAGAPAAAPDPAVAPVPSISTAADYYRDGVRLRAAKNYQDSVKAFTAAIEQHPDWLPAISARAGVYVELKQYDDAIKGYTRLIELDPKRASIYDERGLAYSNSGRHAQGIPDYDRAIELEPMLSAAWNNRGWARLELGQLDLALADLNKAIELNPAYTIALMNRAHLYLKRDDYSRALADFDAILQVKPADEAALAEKATAQKKQRELAAAQ